MKERGVSVISVQKPPHSTFVLYIPNSHHPNTPKPATNHFKILSFSLFSIHFFLFSFLLLLLPPNGFAFLIPQDPISLPLHGRRESCREFHGKELSFRAFPAWSGEISCQILSFLVLSLFRSKSHFLNRHLFILFDSSLSPPSLPLLRLLPCVDFHCSSLGDPFPFGIY